MKHEIAKRVINNTTQLALNHTTNKSVHNVKRDKQYKSNDSLKVSFCDFTTRLPAQQG